MFVIFVTPNKDPNISLAAIAPAQAYAIFIQPAKKTPAT
jgi:hypothetical protein